jgi:hypothetical protein
MCNIIWTIVALEKNKEYSDYTKSITTRKREYTVIIVARLSSSEEIRVRLVREWLSQVHVLIYPGVEQLGGDAAAVKMNYNPTAVPSNCRCELQGLVIQK